MGINRSPTSSETATPAGADAAALRPPPLGPSERSRRVESQRARVAGDDAGPPGSAAASASDRLTERTRWPARLLELVRGPLLATAAVAAQYLLAQTPSPIHDFAPIYLLVVVLVAVVDGRRSALVSGIIMMAYSAYFYSSSGALFTYTTENLLRLMMVVAVILAIALLVGTLRKKTDLLRTELRAGRTQVAETLNSKREFMNDAAHELRTPLTVISGYVSMLQDGTFGALPARWRDAMYVIERKTRELGALVEEMLLSARIQTGALPTATMPLDLREAVRQAVERAEPSVTLEQATLSYELPAEEVLAEVDPDHLGHILDNLINNALTYSDTRPWVKITVSGGSEARVLVKDRGWGVPEAMKQRIFERFVRYRSPAHKSKRGTGLGLSISRELADRYGGSVDLAWTEPGKGSVFVLRLPRVAG